MSLDSLPIEKAEKLAGRRLDRRRKYFIWDMHVDETGEEVCYDAKFLRPCSGCHETGDYGEVYTGKWDEKRKMSIGIGCSECAGHGVRWDSCPAPVRSEKRLKCDPDKS